MIGVVILGAGDIANTHIEALQELGERCQVRALVDVNVQKAEEKRDKYGLNCDVCGDYHELLDRDDIQMATICLPPSLHCQVAEDFLLAGKNVLCEKPMAPTVAECDRMIAAEKKGGAKLAVIAQNRFKQEVMKTKELVESGALGKLLYAQANSLWWRGNHYYDLCWRGTWEKEGGGCTFIHAVHHIDLFLWLMGEVDTVTSLVSNQNHNGSEVEDVSINTIRFKNGAVGSLVSSLLHHGEKQNLMIDGELGSIEIPHQLAVSRQMENGYPVSDDEAYKKLEDLYESLPGLKYTEHLGQIENMIAAIENGTEPLVTSQDGRSAIEFISGVYQSAFTGQTVHFPLTEKDPFYTKEGVMKYAVRFHEKTRSVDGFADVGISVGGTL